jgi:D-3-phosphoglycerate dehydrogenase
VEKGKNAFTGPEVEGKTLGVIGLGAIGVKVANAATKLGMTVYGYDPTSLWMLL